MLIFSNGGLSGLLLVSGPTMVAPYPAFRVASVADPSVYTRIASLPYASIVYRAAFLSRYGSVALVTVSSRRCSRTFGLDIGMCCIPMPGGGRSSLSVDRQ